MDAPHSPWRNSSTDHGREHGARSEGGRWCPLEVQRTLSEIASDFLRVRTPEIDHAESVALERLGRILDCSIATIWDDGPDGKVHRTRVWVDPAKASLNDYPISVIPVHHPTSRDVRAHLEPAVVRFSEHIDDTDARRNDTIIAAPLLGDPLEGGAGPRVVGAVTFSVPRFDQVEDWWSRFWLASIGSFASLLISLRNRVEVETALFARSQLDLAKSRISKLLTDDSPDHQDERIEAVLGIAGVALGADSLSFYEFDDPTETARLRWSWRRRDHASVAETTDAGPAMGDQDVAIGRIDTRVGQATGPVGVLTTRPGSSDVVDTQSLHFNRWLADTLDSHFSRVEIRRAEMARAADNDVLLRIAELLSGRPSESGFQEVTELLKCRIGASHVSIWRMFTPDRLEGRVPRELVARSGHPAGEELEVNAETLLMPAKFVTKLPPTGQTLDYPLDLAPGWVRDTVGHDLEALPRRSVVTSVPYAGEELVHIFCLIEGDCPITDGQRLLLEQAGHLISGALARAAEAAKFEVAFASAPMPMSIRDAGGLLIDCNPAYERFTSRTRAALIGRHVAELTGEHYADPKPAGWTGSDAIEYEMPDGSKKWARVRASEVVVPGLPGIQTLGQLEDITETLVAAERMAFSASRDPLTGLITRRSFIDGVASACEPCCGNACTVMVVDLDNFRLVNEWLGHEAGDSVIVELADRVAAVGRGKGTVFRSAGDRFGIHLPSIHDDATIHEIAEAILEVVRRPIGAPNLDLEMSASIGSASSPGRDCDVEALLRCAEEAMYYAKNHGRDCWKAYDEEVEREITEKASLEVELRDAIDGNQMEVHYQPEVRLSTGHIVGTEALLRWHHPKRGLLSAGVFIGMAEQTGMIVELGRWVLEEATRQAVEWNRQGHHLIMRVNLSARQLRPAVLDEIRAALAKSGLRPDRLCLEVTETAIIDDVETATELLRAIRNLGVKLAIDDFGTGYSSLSYLKEFPFDILKIDKSFVDDVGIDYEATRIIETIVNLAKVLKLDLVAEGIENPRQMADLMRLGVDRAQGFYMARPAPPGDITKLLSD